jgi:hypothetical protein
MDISATLIFIGHIHLHIDPAVVIFCLKLAVQWFFSGKRPSMQSGA